MRFRICRKAAVLCTSPRVLRPLCLGERRIGCWFLTRLSEPGSTQNVFVGLPASGTAPRNFTGWAPPPRTSPVVSRGAPATPDSPGNSDCRKHVKNNSRQAPAKGGQALATRFNWNGGGWGGGFFDWAGTALIGDRQNPCDGLEQRDRD